MNSAVGINRNLGQSIDLGVHTEAFMTRPETCGAAGGAISLWVKIDDPFGYHGIITTLPEPNTLSGSLINYNEGTIL